MEQQYSPLADKRSAVYDRMPPELRKIADNLNDKAAQEARGTLLLKYDIGVLIQRVSAREDVYRHDGVRLLGKYLGVAQMPVKQAATYSRSRFVNDMHNSFLRDFDMMVGMTKNQLDAMLRLNRSLLESAKANQPFVTKALDAIRELGPQLNRSTQFLDQIGKASEMLRMTGLHGSMSIPIAEAFRQAQSVSSALQIAKPTFKLPAIPNEAMSLFRLAETLKSSIGGIGRLDASLTGLTNAVSQMQRAISLPQASWIKQLGGSFKIPFADITSFTAMIAALIGPPSHAQRLFADLRNIAARHPETLRLEEALSETFQKAHLAVGARFAAQLMEQLEAIDFKSLEASLDAVAEPMEADVEAELDEADLALFDALKRLATTDDFSDFATQLNNISRQAIKKSRKTSVIVVLALFLLVSTWDIVKNVVASYIYDALPKFPSSSPQSIPLIVRESRTAVRALRYDPELTKTLRVVACARVFARQGRSTRSMRIVELVPGQVVRVVEKRKRWVRVEWLSMDDGTLRYGWVRSGRLKPIGRRGAGRMRTQPNIMRLLQP